jgi:hypothetical protein
MNREDIIRMAREAGMAGMLTDVVTTLDELEHFASLVAAHEREACAEVCCEVAPSLDGELIREAIRARGNDD